MEEEQLQIQLQINYHKNYEVGTLPRVGPPRADTTTARRVKTLRPTTPARSKKGARFQSLPPAPIYGYARTLRKLITTYPRKETHELYRKQNGLGRGGRNLDLHPGEFLTVHLAITVGKLREGEGGEKWPSKGEEGF